MVRLGFAIASLLMMLGGCRTRFYVPPGGSDAGSDAAPFDGPEPLSLDVTVTGCPRYDVDPRRCSGPPPLTLSFSPVSSPSLTRFRWSFGDGAPDSSDRAPTHTYVLPGTYDVSVIGAGDVGTVPSRHPGLISVAELTVGAPCDVDAQCATGLQCVCGTGQGCLSDATRGLCTTSCTNGVCGGRAVCTDLSLPVTGDAGTTDAGGTLPAAFRRLLCLAQCQQDTDCPPGLICRDLPGGGTVGQQRWARACFPTAYPLGEVGQPCRDATTGALAAGLCAPGVCADLGALGLCSAACNGGAPCPTGSACAVLRDGRAFCLHACTGALDECARDPLADCEPPGGGGSLGFTVSGAAAGARYCAPRSCSVAADCAPSGTCTGGSCVRLP